MMPMMNNIYRKIYKEIKKHDRIVIARHIGPDPDALGSQFGLKELILNTFPNLIIENFPFFILKSSGFQ